METNNNPAYEVGPIETNIPIPRRYTACRSEQAVRERALSLPVGGSFTVAVGPSSPPATDIAIQLAAWARTRGMLLRYRRIDDRSVRIWRCAPSETVEARQL